MFYVNRNDVFITIPIVDEKNGVEIEVGFDLTPYLAVKISGMQDKEIPLTSEQITDMIDSLKEIQSRIGGKNA